MDLFSHMDDEQREKLLAAGWTRCDAATLDQAIEEWSDGDGNRFSLRGAIAELDRREGRRQ